MPLFSSYAPASSFSPPDESQKSAVDLWYQSAEADYRFFWHFADHFDARLGRSGRSARVGWERDGHSIYGILLPDPLASAHLTNDEWYLYYVWGETMFRRTRKEREALKMLVLPDSAEDWAELLRQALCDEVFNVRYEIKPHFINALGDVEMIPSGYEFRLSACAPPNASPSDFQIVGLGETPESAARCACLRWLRARFPEIASL